MSNIYPFPNYCRWFSVDSERFLIANAVVGSLHVASGITMAFVSRQFWGIALGLVMIFSSVINAIVFRGSLLKTRLCGNALGLVTWLHFGNFFVSLLLISVSYQGGADRIFPVFTCGFFSVMGLLMFYLTAWHKNLIVPYSASSRESLQHHDNLKCFIIWRYSLAGLSSLVYGMAVARIKSGLIPGTHGSESIVGLVSACLMLAFSYRKYRLSIWSLIFPASWSVLLGANFVVACVMYAVRATESDTRLYYGISWLVCLAYALFFIIIFATKKCLKEFESSSSTNVVVSGTPKLICELPGSFPTELEARAFGLRRLDEAKKSDSKDGWLERADTNFTDKMVSV